MGLALAANPSDVPVIRSAGRQGVERGREGAHGGGEDAGHHKTTNAQWHDVEDIRAKDVRSGLWLVGGVLLVVGEEQDSDEDEGRGDRQVHKGRRDQAAARLLVGLGGEHPLNHVLIGAEGGHVAQRRPDERGKEGVVARQYQLDVVPQAHRRKMVALLPPRDDARFEAVEDVAFVGSQLRDGSDYFT